MATIALTYGLSALVDDEDMPRLMGYKWIAEGARKKSKHIYAIASETRSGISRNVRMHRIILGLSDDGPIVDHINRNPLDNRKANLRLCTTQTNAFNRTGMPGSSSIYKGVVWHRKANKWQAALRKSGKNIYLGIFDSEEEAALAYDKCAAQEFGEFAYLNFPGVSA